MASVNTTSGREEIAGVEQELARLSDNVKIFVESQMLINTLLRIVKLFISLFMKKARQRAARILAFPPHKQARTRVPALCTPIVRAWRRMRYRSPTVVPLRQPGLHPWIVVPSVARICRSLEASEYKGRTHIDIVFEKHIEHVDAQIKQCPLSEHSNKGQFPRYALASSVRGRH